MKKFINMCKEYNSLENDYNDLDNLYDELEYNFYNSEKERKQLQINNNMLILSNRILKKAYNKVKHENVILLENSKPEYDYQEIKKRNQKLNNEFKRIYSLLKKNICLKLC